MIKWGNPDAHIYFWALLPFIFWILFSLRKRNIILSRIIDREQWSTLIQTYSPKRNLYRHYIRITALAILLIALSRPQWGYEWERVRQQGLHILVALDTSKSMLAQDIKPNRLQQAKWGIRDLIKELQGDRIGLIAFAGSAFLQCPATSDYAAFRMVLDDLYAGIIPVGGSDIYEAISCAINSFDKVDSGNADRVIILISDGETHTGNSSELITALKRKNIRVFSIGVGTQDGELIQTPSGFVKDEEGLVVKTRLEEKELEQIARETGGFYVRSAQGDFGLERIYHEGISKLQKEEQDERMSRIWTERFPLFLAIVLVLLILEALISPTKRKILND